MIPMSREDEDCELRRLIEVERIAETDGHEAARDFALRSRETGDQCLNCGHFVGDHVLVAVCRAAECDCASYKRQDAWARRVSVPPAEEGGARVRKPA